ncbi:unnamed protein product [Brachionus calyciflorus]|uniref:Uncharacterized protein n=1 Tax=Brachionus calyciflorus TaxID=104777 RepID=A0A814RXG3_9BILA|nr:unnamed protein product [Brachionus calyciflorus]
MNKIFIFLIFIYLSVLNVSGRSYSRVISSVRHTNWGNWHAPVFCPGNSFAIGIQIIFLSYQWTKDDSHLNAIRLICDDIASTRIQSGEGPFGSWLT